MALKINKQRIDEKLRLPELNDIVPATIDTCSWMIYGRKRIGKTSLASRFPNSVIFSFENASQRISALQCICPSWERYLDYLKLYDKEKSSGKSIPKIAIIDTGFEAYLRCEEYVCKINNVDHTSDDGKLHIWERIRKVFREGHLRLVELGMSLIVICHDQEIEQTTRSGQKFNAVIPKLGKIADDYYRAVIENVVYYHYRDKARWMTLRGSDYIMAGVIGDEDAPFFMTSDNNPIYAVPASKSAKEAFNNLEKAFNCEQLKSYEDETELYEESEVKKSIIKKALGKK
jgi:hypothetical protein